MIIANELDAGLLVLSAAPAILLWCLGFIYGRRSERGEWIDAALTDKTVLISGDSYAVMRIINDPLNFDGEDEYPDDARHP
jgi:hypothetical protein